MRELTEQAGIGQAWTLTRLALDLDADQRAFGGGPVVLILDEAGMASTRETARVMAHARAADAKVIAIGDSGQLSSVQAGGWLSSLTERLGSYELREVMRQRDPRERQLLGQVRRGDPTDYVAEKSARRQLHISIGDGQGQGGGEYPAIVAWREHQAACPWGQAVLIVRDNERRERLNTLIRAELKHEGRLGESVHIAGCNFAVGDRVVARRNDRERAVDNGTRGTVIAIDPTEKDLVVRTDAGAHRRLDASYVTEHLQHAYVLTAHTMQGATVEWAGVVGRPEDFTRNWSYTALSRARQPTELFIVDTPTQHELDRAEIAPGQTLGLRDERTPIERLKTAMRCRDDEDLALDRIDTERKRGPAGLEPTRARLPAEAATARPSVVELQAELEQLRERIGRYPEHLADQLQAARNAQAEAQRVADEARARIAELEQPAHGVLRRRAADSAERALQRQRLKLTEGRSRRPPSVSATSQAASPTAGHGRRSAARSASAPQSSTRSSRTAAASTYASRWNDQPPTSLRRSALCLTSPAVGAPGSKPPPASRRTASTTLSPTPTTPSDHPQATAASGRPGNAPTTTSDAPNETSATAPPSSTPTRSNARPAAARRCSPSGTPCG